MYGWWTESHSFFSVLLKVKLCLMFVFELKKCVMYNSFKIWPSNEINKRKSFENSSTLIWKTLCDSNKKRLNKMSSDFSFWILYQNVPLWLICDVSVYINIKYYLDHSWASKAMQLSIFPHENFHKSDAILNFASNIEKQRFQRREDKLCLRYHYPQKYLREEERVYSNFFTIFFICN